MSKYPQDQVKAALELYREHGLAHAARETGIPKATIGKWARKHGLATLQYEKTAQATRARHLTFLARRAEVRERLLDRILDLDTRMDQPHEEFRGQHATEVTYDRAPSDAVKAYATSIGILIDKLRLEMGEATSRDEQVSESEFDREVRELVAKMRAADQAPTDG